VGEYEPWPQKAYEASSGYCTGLKNALGASVDTENPVRIENAGIRSVREINIVSTMTPFFIALLALVTSTFRTRAAQQAEIVALRHQIAVLQQSARVVSAFGNRTACCGFGCPASGRAGGSGCAF